MTLIISTPAFNIAATPDTESAPAVGALQDGTWGIVWSDYSSAHGYSVHWARDNSAGTVVQTGVINGDSQGFAQSDIASGSNNRLLIVSSATASSIGLTGQYREITESEVGNSPATIGIVNAYTTQDQTWPKIAQLNDGSYWVAWMDGREAPSPYESVYARHLAADGTPLGSDVKIADGSGYNGFTPSEPGITIDKTVSGGFVLGWVTDLDPSNSTDASKFTFQIFDSGGNAQTGQIIAVGNGIKYGHPEVAGLSDGSVALAYSLNSHVYVALYKSDGTFERTIDAAVALGSGAGATNFAPDIKSLSGGGFALAWTNASSGSQSIEAAVFDNTGAVTSPAIAVDSGTNVQRPDLTVLNSGQVAVAWEAIVNGDWNIKGAVLSTAVNDAPIAAFTAGPNPAAPTQTLSFNGSSSSDPDPSDSIVSYAWDFGDGSNATGITVTHSYSLLEPTPPL